MLTGNIDRNDIAHVQASDNVRARAKAVQLFGGREDFSSFSSLRASTCIDDEELVLERT
jgi:hypothetical protein